MERNDRMPKKKCKTRSNKQANERVSGRNGRTDKGGSGLGQGRQVRTGQCQVRSESGKKRYLVGNDAGEVSKYIRDMHKHTMYLK